MHRNICHSAMYTVLPTSTEKKFFDDAAAYTEFGRIYLSEFRKVLSTFVTRRRLSLLLFAAVLSLLCASRLSLNAQGAIGQTYAKLHRYSRLSGRRALSRSPREGIWRGRKESRIGPTPKSAPRPNAKPTQVKPNLDGSFPSERNWHQTSSERIRRERFCG
jgi:hypothetical protein